MLIPPEWNGWPLRSKVVYVLIFGGGMAIAYFILRRLIYGY